ncbi:MAG: SpoIIE family protein phosphatase [Micrococcales bacterium]|nr:SpoIIE family protein phosphatase [Micrococcales bacterium]
MAEPRTLARHRAAPTLDDEVPFWLVEHTLGSTSTSVAVTRAAGDNPVVWVNDGFTTLTGYSREEALGRNLRFLQGENTDHRAVRQVHQALALGGTAATTLLNYRKDGMPFWNRMLIVPVCDDVGTITHHIAAHTDASLDVANERATVEAVDGRGGTELLTRVSDVLTQHLDYHEASAALVQTVVSEMADWGFIVLLDENGHVEHVSLAAADPAKQPVVDRLAARDHTWYHSSSQMRAALAARPGDVPMPRRVDVDWIASQVSPDHLALHLELGLGSALTVPLFTRDQPLGVMVLEAADPEQFTVSSGVTMAQIGRRAGLALDNIRLYRAERTAALTLQHRLAPSVMVGPDLDVAAAYRPSGRHVEVGGDWYDVFQIDGRRTMLAVGDVVGHDMAAAAAMGQLSVLLRARATLGGSPSRVFKDFMRALRAMRRDDVASIAYLQWLPTPEGCHVEYTNLGHPAPLVRLPDGTVCMLPAAHCAPIGVHNPEVAIGQDELDLPTGSVVVLYTDGLVERRDRPLEDGLATLARSLCQAPDGSAEQIRDHLLTTLVHDQPEDDVCLLVARGQGTGTRLARRRTVVPAPLLRLDDTGKMVRAPG